MAEPVDVPVVLPQQLVQQGGNPPVAEPVQPINAEPELQPPAAQPVEVRYYSCIRMRCLAFMFNPFTAKDVSLVFTLVDARRFYSSMEKSWQPSG